MNAQMLSDFLMWCTILNAGLLILSSLIMMFAGDFAYGLHRRWFAMPRETFNIAIYSFLGLYKILVIVFNLVPWAALMLAA